MTRSLSYPFFRATLFIHQKYSYRLINISMDRKFSCSATSRDVETDSPIPRPELDKGSAPWPCLLFCKPDLQLQEHKEFEPISINELN